MSVWEKGVEPRLPRKRHGEGTDGTAPRSRSSEAKQGRAGDPLTAGEAAPRRPTASEASAGRHPGPRRGNHAYKAITANYQAAR